MGICGSEQPGLIGSSKNLTITDVSQGLDE